MAFESKTPQKAHLDFDVDSFPRLLIGTKADLCEVTKITFSIEGESVYPQQMLRRAREIVTMMAEGFETNEL